jgi:hypothetical protein
MAAPRHSHSSPELWQLYFDSFADRFREFFPQRNQREVVSKLRDILSKRRLKENGEEEFWGEIQSETHFIY